MTSSTRNIRKQFLDAFQDDSMLYTEPIAAEAFVFIVNRHNCTQTALMPNVNLGGCSIFFTSSFSSLHFCCT